MNMVPVIFKREQNEVAGLPTSAERGMDAPGADAVLLTQQTPRFTWRFLLLVAVCVIAVMTWRATVNYLTGVFDIYPLYYGAKAWLLTGNAYVTQSIVPASQRGSLLYYTGNMYPLPAVLLILPLAAFPPKIASMLWLGCLVAGMLLVFRLTDTPLWWAFSLPIVDGIRIEQFTMLIVILQVLALWAWRERRPWLLALCGTIILTKPNHGLFFVLALTLLARNWRQILLVGAAFWGGSLLLDPHWITEWLPTLTQYRTLTHQPILWELALFALPLLALREWVAAATILQFLVQPFPIMSTYATAAVPITILHDPRSRWLLPLSYLWVFPAALFGAAWATALTILLPATLLIVVSRQPYFRPLRRATA